MRNVGRKLAFVLAASNHGTMITNRFDYRMSGPDAGIGVGYQLLEAGAFDPIEVELALQLIESRRCFHGDGVVAIDCGANIGVHAIEWATAMTGWGSVIAIEPQERIYYALAGNIAIHNCFNAIAMHAANSDSRLSPAFKLRQSGAETARRLRIYRPAHRLFGRKNGSEDIARCPRSSARRSYQA